ncbi:MAG: gliding motility protein GldC [Chitinophagaceae bacterium]
MKKQSNIRIQVDLDENKIPEAIEWSATDSNLENAHQAKAMMLAFWDSAEKTALRIDLWTPQMMVDEMVDFFYQTLLTMADTYQRATQLQEQAEDMRIFARAFMKKFKDTPVQP